MVTTVEVSEEESSNSVSSEAYTPTEKIVLSELMKENLTINSESKQIEFNGKNIQLSKLMVEIYQE